MLPTWCQWLDALTAFQQTAGAVFFVTDMIGWYIFIFLMLAAVEFPIQLPMGDLSHLVPARKMESKEE